MILTNKPTISLQKLQASIFSFGMVMLLLGGCGNNATPEATTPGSADKPNAPATSSSPAAQSGKIDINSAAIAELDKLELPGTKPSLSERIQGGRPYKTLEDLVTKKVISEDEFKLIKELISTGKSK
jgi:DNA uptake protein ComE-like DNA-binding protein